MFRFSCSETQARLLSHLLNNSYSSVALLPTYPITCIQPRTCCGNSFYPIWPTGLFALLRNMTGFEPATSTPSVWRSSRLSYIFVSDSHGSLFFKEQITLFPPVGSGTYPRLFLPRRLIHSLLYRPVWNVLSSHVTFFVYLTGIEPAPFGIFPTF